VLLLRSRSKLSRNHDGCNIILSRHDTFKTVRKQGCLLYSSFWNSFFRMGQATNSVVPGQQWSRSKQGSLGLSSHLSSSSYLPGSHICSPERIFPRSFFAKSHWTSNHNTISEFQTIMLYVATRVFVFSTQRSINSSTPDPRLSQVKVPFHHLQFPVGAGTRAWHPMTNLL